MYRHIILEDIPDVLPSLFLRPEVSSYHPTSIRILLYECGLPTNTSQDICWKHVFIISTNLLWHESIYLSALKAYNGMKRYSYLPFYLILPLACNVCPWSAHCKEHWCINGDGFLIIFTFEIRVADQRGRWRSPDACPFQLPYKFFINCTGFSEYLKDVCGWPPL